MNDKIRILFVDDEVRILKSFQRMARHMRDEWETEFVDNGEWALQTMEKGPFDIVVSDMRMPGMNGTQLLTEVKTRYPNTIRIILSGQTDESALYGVVGSMHQFLSKPCNFNSLKAIVARVISLGKLISGSELKALLTQVDSLPSLPTLYDELVKTMKMLDFSLNDIGHIISQDMGMTAKILQIANSAYFCFSEKIISANHAVQILGIDTIKTLVLSYQIFSKYTQKNNMPIPIDQLWNHGLTVGAYASRIAKIENVGSDLEGSAFTAGVMHEIGRLILIDNFPDRYRETIELAKTQGIELFQAEQETFQITHSSLGAYLLGLWGLPGSIVEAVGYHHMPSKNPCQSITAATFVHVADIFCQDVCPWQKGMAPAEIDEGYLTRLNLLKQIPVWQKACAQDTE